MKNYIYLDLDGVLADFLKEAAKYPGQSGSHACRTIPGFFQALEVYPGAIAFVDKLESLFPGKIRFLSSAVLERPEAWSEKVIWIQTHFPKYSSNLILVKEKDAVGAPGDILIDDSPTWNGADSFRGHLITFNTNNIPAEYDRIIKILLGLDKLKPSKF